MEIKAAAAEMSRLFCDRKAAGMCCKTVENPL